MKKSKANTQKSKAIIVMAFVAMLSFVACNQETRTVGIAVEADSMMNAAMSRCSPALHIGSCLSSPAIFIE